MNHLLSDYLWKNADDHLSQAMKNMDTPQSMDAQKTCLNCKVSMTDFLKSHLIANGIEPIEKAPLDVLLRQCASFDERFRRLDMSKINCRYEIMNEDHCTESSKLEACISKVSELKVLSGDIIV